MKSPVLPKAFYWIGGIEPKPSGGYLNWHKPENYSACQRWMQQEPV
jgi:hypothetical protein